MVGVKQEVIFTINKLDVVFLLLFCFDMYFQSCRTCPCFLGTDE